MNSRGSEKLNDGYVLCMYYGFLITLVRQVFILIFTDEEHGDSEWCSKSIPSWVRCRAELHTPVGSSEPSLPRPRGAEGF